MARPKAVFGASIGRKRLARSIDPATADYTRNSREAMKGIVNNYRKLVQQIEESVPEVLIEALEPTFQKSQVYCPFKTGALRDSGYLTITDFRGKPRVEIGYGAGGKPEYAALQHENLEYRHKYPTRAKWLQAALEEDADEIQQRIIKILGGMV